MSSSSPIRAGQQRKKHSINSGVTELCTESARAQEAAPTAITASTEAAVKSDRGLTEREDRLLTIKEVSELTGLSVGGLYHLSSQRRIPTVRLSARCIRFRLSDLYQWWDQLTERPKP